jgi:hypothetical protein
MLSALFQRPHFNAQRRWSLCCGQELGLNPVICPERELESGAPLRRNSDRDSARTCVSGP